MSHPTVWMFDTMFYPLGNTTAISLTQDLSPEQEADILLLGCGDPRSILYTVYADVTSNGPRKLDVTCCDFEPAVLARNILLFVLIEENEPLDLVWNIFFHFYIDKTASARLADLSRRLAAASATSESWKQSKWGTFLKIVDSQTLLALHRHWTQYSEFDKLPADRINRLRREHSQVSKRLADPDSKNVSVSRSAGILWHQAMPSMAELFKRYWKTGTTFTSPSDTKAATELNPTFVYSMSGETFNPHYGTFPQGFHLVSAFAPISSDPLGPVISSDRGPMETAKRQFTAWCEAFRASRSAEAIILRFFSGEATAFCRALDIFATTGRAQTGLFAAQWCGADIDLGDCTGMPTSFDVIDTSNLMDHLGAVNLLVITKPLLKRNPATQSVLLTETLLPSGKDATRSFLDRMCADTPTIALLLGLAPRAYLSSFTTNSNAHEILVSAAFREMAQYHERVVWVDPVSGDQYSALENFPILFDETDLAKILFRIYAKMFEDERMAKELMTNPTLAAARAMSEAHYHRESFVLFLRLVKSRVRVTKGDWDGVVNSFLSFAANNKESILEMNHYQDLCLQLHLYGIFSVTSLQPAWQLTPRVGNPNYDIFDGWDGIPPAVCLVLVVPRKSLGVLMSESAGSPRLQVNILGGSSYHNNYSSLQGVWGRCVRDPEDPNKLSIEEDPQGVHGTSDLVVTLWTASYVLVTANTTICLALRLNPFSLVTFSSKLGTNLELFRTSLESKKHVHLLRDRPMVSSRVQKTSQLYYDPPTVSQSEAPPCQVEVTNSSSESKIKSLTVRVEIVSSEQQAALLDGASVSCASISPCTMEVVIREVGYTVPYPYPVQGSSNRLRIARKSHYVEVIVNIAEPLGTGGYALDLFPIVRHGTYSPWNVHHIHLDRMPMLDVRAKNQFNWMTVHCGFQASDRERVLRQTAKHKPENVMINLKESFYAMFAHFVGLQQSPIRAFCLCESSQNLGVYTVVLVAGIRLDLASSTIVLDAAVVPLSVDKMPFILQGIKKLHTRDKEIEQLMTDDAEVVAWKRLLPAAVERCRTWSHTPNCEYALERAIPLSIEVAQNPICSCGQGIGFTSPEWNVSWWKELLPYATRVAISPLFAVSYLDRVAGQLLDEGISSVNSLRNRQAEKSGDSCWSCGGTGKPKLLLCSKCKKATYCSSECQRKDWKDGHKGDCRAQ